MSPQKVVVRVRIAALLTVTESREKPTTAYGTGTLLLLLPRLPAQLQLEVSNRACDSGQAKVPQPARACTVHSRSRRDKGGK